MLVLCHLVVTLLIPLLQLLEALADVVNVLDGEQHVDGAKEEQQEVNPQEVVPAPDEGLGAWVAREIDPQVHKASMLEVELLGD
jgi:hypothetical protein